MRASASDDCLFSSPLSICGDALIVCTGTVLAQPDPGQEQGRVDPCGRVGAEADPVRLHHLERQPDAERERPLRQAYGPLEANVAKVKDYLIAKGVPASEILPDAVSEEPVYEQVKNLKTGQYVATTQITGYTLTQTMEVKSHSVDLVDGLSRQSTELISQGVPFKSETPLYLYTKLSELKVSMQAEAAKNARDRAEQIAASSGCRLGEVRGAKMFVPQITPLYSSSERSEDNADDTSSLDKNITAVVSVDYSIR